MIFNWFKKKIDEPLELKVVRIDEPKNALDNKVIYYHMVVGNRIVGICDLRFGMNEELYYAGNIGYTVFSRYRGHNYAYKATLLLLKIAKEEGMDSIIITCSPDNIASRKTIEKLNAKLLAVEDVPSYHWLYKNGEKVKNIYEIRI